MYSVLSMNKKAANSKRSGVARLLLLILGVLIASSLAQQQSLSSCPSDFGSLAEQDEFSDPNNEACYQEVSRERYGLCGDLEFCFGVMVTHPDAFHFNCCDQFPSCQSYKQLESTLDILLALSWVDIAVSSVIIIALLCHLYYNRSSGNNMTDVLKKVTVVIIVMELVDLSVCSAIISIVASNDALETAQNLRDASCFKQTGDETSISNVISELEGYRNIAIAEIVIDVVVLILHVIEVRRRDDEEPSSLPLLAIAYIGDLTEFALAVVSLVVYLQPTINAFDQLHIALSNVNSLSPCIRTGCVIAALLPARLVVSSPQPSATTLSPPTPFPNMAPVPPTPTTRPPTPFPTPRPTTAMPITVPPTPLPTPPPTSPPTIPPTSSPPNGTVTLFGQEWDPHTTTRMDLTRSSISGSIPTEIGQLTQLTYLDLDSNSLTGSIPAEIGQLMKLTYLDLDSNSLTGPTPTEIGQLTQLTYLNLDSNSLTGSISAEIGQLTQLTFLALWANSLTGSIPAEIGSLTQLTRLDLPFNYLTGSIPAEIGSLTQLTAVWMNSNSLTGSIPAEIGQLTHLTLLSLRSNNLSGPVPTNALANLVNLSSGLWLYDNQLSGSVPSSLCSLDISNGIEIDCGEIACDCCEAGPVGSQCP